MLMNMYDNLVSVIIDFIWKRLKSEFVLLNGKSLNDAWKWYARCEIEKQLIISSETSQRLPNDTKRQSRVTVAENKKNHLWYEIRLKYTKGERGEPDYRSKKLREVFVSKSPPKPQLPLGFSEVIYQHCVLCPFAECFKYKYNMCSSTHVFE